MTQGKRIRFIREFRNMTQKELGLACGFSESSTDVRIRQYESDQKSPKSDVPAKTIFRYGPEMTK